MKPSDKHLDPLLRPTMHRAAASQRRAMQAAMAAAVRAMRTSTVRAPGAQTRRQAGPPPAGA